MYRTKIKRILDILLASVGLLLTLLPCLLIALLVFLDEPGPVTFRQKRFGVGKTYFEILKFRTMKKGAPRDVPTHLMTDPEQYLTRFGKILRRTSLDELPQLWNILKGEMSFVGPRPALWNQEDLIEARDRYGANDVLPGLTGWAQINGRDELGILQKAKLDGCYANTLKKGGLRAFFLDLRCFFGTIPNMITDEP